MLVKKSPEEHARDRGHVDISDLESNPVVMFQHKHHFLTFIIMTFIFPSAIAGIGWGDWPGGITYAAILRCFLVQQATFCVNSLAHWLGDKPYNHQNSARNNLLTAILTCGEGYHNYHHTFPCDWRNAIAWWQYDPTKWAIWIWYKLGLAYNLQQFRLNEIEKVRISEQYELLDQQRKRLDWGIPIDQLPVFEWGDYVCMVSEGRELIVIAGIVYDVASFADKHPGGGGILRSACGKDATAWFNGGIYRRE
jgi:stearoyl-CoA desaturase (delta-9 desaturase)